MTFAPSCVKRFDHVRDGYIVFGSPFEEILPRFVGVGHTDRSHPVGKNVASVMSEGPSRRIDDEGDSDVRHHRKRAHRDHEQAAFGLDQCNSGQRSGDHEEQDAEQRDGEGNE